MPIGPASRIPLFQNLATSQFGQASPPNQRRAPNVSIDARVFRSHAHVEITPKTFFVSSQVKYVCRNEPSTALVAAAPFAKGLDLAASRHFSIL
jgi:hypothetical protein